MVILGLETWHGGLKMVGRGCKLVKEVEKWPGGGQKPVEGTEKWPNGGRKHVEVVKKGLAGGPKHVEVLKNCPLEVGNMSRLSKMVDRGRKLVNVGEK